MTPRKTLVTRRSPRALIACALSLLLMLASVSAFSDTYNFYFSKPKKKAAEPARSDDDRDDGDESTEKGAATPGAGTVASTPGQNPIIINNNNNIGLLKKGVDTEPQKPVVVEPSVQHDDNGLSASVSSVSEYSPWRFGLSALLFYGGDSWIPGNIYNGELSGGYYGGSSRQWGGLVSLGYFFTRSIGINAYGGGTFGSYAVDGSYLFGGDLEVLPFRITIGHLDVIELGLLAGGRTNDPGTSGSFEIHGGARVNINFDRHFGLTAALRTNFKNAMLEGGLITHF